MAAASHLNLAGDLWVYDLGGRPPIKLTFDSGAVHCACGRRTDSRIIYEHSNGPPASSPFGRRQHEQA